MDKRMSNYRADFPILDQQVNDEQLVYLDNAATTQKPRVVIDAITKYYYTDNANVHRGVHTLAERATEQFEGVRDKVARFINAPTREEIIYTKGTTEALNWVAAGYGKKYVKAGDEIVISCAEHHSNLVPWQQLAKRNGAILRYLDLTADGFIDLDKAQDVINDKTAIVAVNHASNVLGVVNPISKLAKMAHQHGAIMVVDGAQSTPHMPIDVQALDADFYAFSGHKLLAPTGIGILWGKSELLAAMSPLEFGGEMIDWVELQETTFKKAPLKFEGGTQNIAGVVGLGAAIDYLTRIGMNNIKGYEQELVDYVLPKLQQIEGLTIYGPPDAKKHTGVISFNLKGLHPHDVATALDMEGVAVRAGHHCAQPLMRYLNIAATARASFYFYNTKEDAQRLVDAIIATKEFFQNGTV
ncbi:cysteine desulfurase [Ligilactobacillus sp. WILCCON 0076]|uniref:cysteine desulfurase n=1 Tax=Ligilactobacillus ubinensis TaxID=2876789 RepID=A0A9X2FGE3_9LACO|nr:cysteine desulfurase [Ligilactobacillus ubinensis]MCP0885937.1 cysteine desulfurase [Ligilactobacillus ubinensis]